MRLDKIREREIEKRRGFTKRFLLALIWLSLTVFAATLLVNWLFDSGRLTYNQIVVYLRLPPSVSFETVKIGIIVLTVVVVQFITLVIVALATPAGRERPGKPTTKPKALDVDDRSFYQ